MNDPVLAGETKFWDLAAALLGQPGVTRSTMMGLPCLRWNGVFLASCDRRSGDLLVKLAETRVADLVAADRAQPFAPAGRRSREWAAVPHDRSPSWKRLLDEALEHAINQPAAATENRKR